MLFTPIHLGGRRGVGYGRFAGSGKRGLDYPVLGLPDIERVLSKTDSRILFLWTIDKYLFEAQEIAESLGYHLHARLVWDKMNGVAPAFTVRFSHEYLLWCYKRPMLKIPNDQRGKFRTVFQEGSTRHSRKPEIAYQMIEALYPQASKLELFARYPRDGWDVWGNEVTPTVTLPL